MKDLVKSESVKVFKEDDDDDVAGIRETDELQKAQPSNRLVQHQVIDLDMERMTDPKDVIEFERNMEGYDNVCNYDKTRKTVYTEGSQSSKQEISPFDADLSASDK